MWGDRRITQLNPNLTMSGVPASLGPPVFPPSYRESFVVSELQWTVVKRVSSAAAAQHAHRGGGHDARR